MNHPLLTVIICVPLTVIATSAEANWITGADLERHCSAYLSNPGGAEAVVCTAFVQGYLSADVADTAPDVARDDDFAARAARTRVGSRLRSLRENYAARSAYCVDGVSPEAVVEAVAQHISVSGATEETAPARKVHGALVAQFPCSDS